MSLEEFVSMWNDDDPWSVPDYEWYRRFREKGIPEKDYLLVHPHTRILDPKTVAAIRPPRLQSVDPFLLPKLASTINFERRKQGTSLRGLSRASGVDIAKLSRFEAGRIDLRIHELDRIARALGLLPGLLLETARLKDVLIEDGEEEEDYDYRMV